MNKRANQRTKRNEPSTAEGAEPLVPERIARFLGSLPITAEPTEWMQGFCAAVKEFVGDVDIILVELSLSHDDNEPDVWAGTRHINLLRPRETQVLRYEVVEHYLDSQYFLRNAMRSGYNLGEYHPVPQYEYYAFPNANPDLRSGYLGAMGLLRSRQKGPISERTIEFFESLEPFFRFVFSTFSHLNRASKPVANSLFRVMHRAFVAFGLSRRDRDIVLMRLHGFTHSEIANILHCTEYAVARRITHMYRQTGCYSFLELYQRVLREFRMEERPEVGEDGVVTVY